MTLKEKINHMASVIDLMRAKLPITKTHFVSEGDYHILIETPDCSEWWDICRGYGYYQMIKINHNLEFAVDYCEKETETEIDAEKVVEEITALLVNDAHYKFN